jgi:hypothetical protein
MLFAGTAAAGAVALMLHFASVPAPPVSVDRVLSSIGYGLDRRRPPERSRHRCPHLHTFREGFP